MLAYFCKHRFLLSLSPAIPTQCGGVHKMKVTTQPVPLGLKGQKLLAQGIALGYYRHKLVALKGQKL